MNYLRFPNRSIYANCFLLLAVFMLGFFQLRNSYANRLNNRACKIAMGNSAVNALNQAIRLNGDNPLYYANLGLLYTRMDSSITLDNLYSGKIIYSNKLDTAILYYHIAESLKNSDPLFCQNLALLYALKGDLVRAIENIEKVSDNTNDIWCLLISAFLYENFDIKKAEESYVKVLFISPGLFDSLLYSNLMSRDSVLGEKIENKLLSYLKKNSAGDENQQAMARLAKVLWNKGDKAEAEVLWNKVTKIMPMWSKPWLYLGRIAEERGDSVNAISCYRKAECLNPIDFAFSLSGENLNHNIMTFNVDTLLKYVSSIRRLVYQDFYDTTLFSEGMAVNDFYRYRKQL
ncbi:tetratricopeptide repeat protein [Parabacteroides goldsteinii]|uniref:tetratricopeptide repeat protein n=1 Tax=Parabacteroides goldsteinii TaxID=328812 RepID=UPI003AB458FD